jgi:hypothetical protein
MMASRLCHRGPVIPAQTDHLEDMGVVIGTKVYRGAVDDSRGFLMTSVGNIIN